MIQGPRYRNTPRDGADLHVIFPAAVPEARPLIPVKAPGAKGEPTIRLLRRFPAELGAPAETVRWTGERRGLGGGGGGGEGRWKGKGGGKDGGGGGGEPVWNGGTSMRGCGEVVPGDGPFTGESSLDSEHCTHYSFLSPPPHLSPSPPPPPAQKPRSPYSSSPKCQRPVDSALFSPAFFFFFFFFSTHFFFFFFFFGWFGSSRGSVTTGRHYDVVLCQDIVRGMAQRRSTSPRTPAANGHKSRPYAGRVKTRWFFRGPWGIIDIRC